LSRYKLDQYNSKAFVNTPDILASVAIDARAISIRHGLARLNFTKAGATIHCRNVEEAIMSDRDGNSFLWFLAGLGVGAIVGVLYAPRSGTETRQAIFDKAEQGSEYVRNRAREAREQASDWADRGRDVLNQQKEQFKSAYEAGRQAYHQTTAESNTPKNV
jgi:gas vesicle protein